jgi:hypothetical protein
LLFGGGGYTLRNVPRVWATAFAALAELRPDNRIPKMWAESFRKLTGEDAPGAFYDNPTDDEPRTLEETRKVLAELRGLLGTVSH